MTGHSEKRFSPRGVYAAVPTPFDEDGNLVLDRMGQNVGMWNISPLDGLVVLGVVGELMSLTGPERIGVLREAAANLGGGKRLLAGVGCPSTRDTLNLAESAALAGCDAVVAILPTIFRLPVTPASLVRHFVSLAEDSPVPVIIQDFSCTSSPSDSAPQLLDELVDHPNIVGFVWDASGDDPVLEKTSTLPDEFSMMTSSVNRFAETLVAGAAGGMLSLASVLPWECSDIFRLLRDGEFEEARRKQDKLVPAEEAIAGAGGVPALKAALTLLGYYGGYPRLPVGPLDVTDIDAIRAALRASNFVGC